MKTNNHKIVDFDAVLDAKFGAEGTKERVKAEEDAYSFYSGQILQNARKDAKMTQAELAEKIQTTKSYISKPSVDYSTKSHVLSTHRPNRK